jgi:hypothetical protein
MEISHNMFVLERKPMAALNIVAEHIASSSSDIAKL